jgi:hypothetical protein
MKTITDLRKEAENKISEIKRIYSEKEQELRRKKGYVEINDFIFDIITDVKPTSYGMRYAKRKAIFLHHLETYFDWKLKDEYRTEDEKGSDGTYSPDTYFSNRLKELKQLEKKWDKGLDTDPSNEWFSRQINYTRARIDELESAMKQVKRSQK